MNTDIVQAMHMAEEMKGYADKHLIDATSSQEPDNYDKPIELPCYEAFLDTQLVDEGYKELDKAMDSKTMPF